MSGGGGGHPPQQDWAQHEHPAPAPWLQSMVTVLQSPSFRAMQGHPDVQAKVGDTIRALLPRVDLRRDVLATLVFLRHCAHSFAGVFQSPRQMMRWVLDLVRRVVPTLTRPSSSRQVLQVQRMRRACRGACADLTVAMLRTQMELSHSWTREVMTVLQGEGIPHQLCGPFWGACGYPHLCMRTYADTHIHALTFTRMQDVEQKKHSHKVHLTAW